MWFVTTNYNELRKDILVKGGNLKCKQKIAISTQKINGKITERCSVYFPSCGFLSGSE